MFGIRNLDSSFQAWPFSNTFESNGGAVRRGHVLIRCAFGLCLAVVGVGFRYLMIPYWGFGPPLVTFYPAILLAAVFGGWVAGLTATCACFFAADYLLLNPLHSLRISESGDLFELTLFALVSLLITGFVELLVHSRETARREKVEAAALARIAKKAQQEAEAASRAKDEFMARVSHELRSPLQLIMGGIHILKTKDYGLGTEAVPVFEMIERGAETETRLIEDLLDMCRCANAKMSLHCQAVRLRELVEMTITAMRPDFDAKCLNVSFRMLGPDKEVFVDSQRVQQIAANLLSNAIKFTDPGGRITIELDGSMSSSVDLRISDSGIGIEEKLQAELFEPFRQGESAQKFGGLGLGLAIVKDLVELHGGTVHVQSEGPQRGTTFTVRFPLLTPDPQTPKGCGTPWREG